MHEDIDSLAGSLLELMRFFTSPRQDGVLLRTAGVELDRALFPLLVMVERWGPLSVAELADQVGRDHSTVSRQLAKLEGLCLIARPVGTDRRVRAAGITAEGRAVVSVIASARRRLLAGVLDEWSAAEILLLARFNRRFVDALKAASDRALQPTAAD